MLMAVSFLDGEVQILANDGVFVIKTERQLFLDLLAAGNAASKISVEAWRLQTFLRENGQLYAAPDEKLCTFRLASDMKQPDQRRAAAAELPFGLQVPKRKRKVNPGKCKAKAKAKVASAKSKTARPKAPKETVTVIDLDTESEADMGSASESSSEGNGGEDDDNDAANDAPLNVHEESETMAPVSATAHAQEQGFARLANEMNEMDALREEVAQTIRANEPPPGSRTSSFFSKELGLDDGAVAPTGRAVCLCCKTQRPLFVAPLQITGLLDGFTRFAWVPMSNRPGCECAP